MTLNAIEQELVRNSFRVLSRDLETHSQDFYELLFKREPHLRALFREDLMGQGMKFMTTLRMIVDNLDSEEKIAGNYVELGQLHAKLGVAASDFEPMREALIDTIRMVMAEEFTLALEEAWRKAFDHVSANMIKRGEMVAG